MTIVMTGLCQGTLLTFIMQLASYVANNETTPVNYSNYTIVK